MPHRPKHVEPRQLVRQGSRQRSPERLSVVLSAWVSRQREPMGSYTTRNGITPFCRQWQWGFGTGALGRRVSTVHQRPLKTSAELSSPVTAFERVLHHWNARHRVHNLLSDFFRAAQINASSRIWLPSRCSSEMCSQQTDWFQTLWEEGCECLSCHAVAKMYLSLYFFHWCCTWLHSIIALLYLTQRMPA